MKAIDSGPDKGIEICAKEGELGLELMQSLPPYLQRKAQTYANLHDDAMPDGRWNLADQVSPTKSFVVTTHSAFFLIVDFL